MMCTDGGSTSTSSSRIFILIGKALQTLPSCYREGPTDVAVLLQRTLSALYRAKRKRIDAQPDDTRQAEHSTYQRQGKK